MRHALVVVIVLGAASSARADRVIRLGTVGKGVDRAAVEASLDGAFRTMTPCFRRAGDGGATIKVKVEVGSDGEVVSASAGKGQAAQCVAGLLAVTKFPAAAWKGEVQVDAISPEAWLNAALGKHQGELAGCQSKDGAGKGEVALQLAIAKSGDVTAVAIEKSGAGKAIAECAKAAALAIRLGALPGGQDVKYRMSVSYKGGGGGGSTSTSTSTSTSGDSGIAKGALGGGAVQEAWVAGRAKVLACGAKMGKEATIRVSFAIRANGTVKNVVFKDSAVGKTVEECVDKELRAVKFPTASGETQVTLPIAWKK